MKKALVLAMLASPAMAQEPKCFPYDEVVQGTQEQGLSLMFSGLTGDQMGLLQVYGSPDQRWIMVSVTLQGVTCLLSGGQNYEAWGAPLAGEES